MVETEIQKVLGLIATLIVVTGEKPGGSPFCPSILNRVKDVIFLKVCRIPKQYQKNMTYYERISEGGGDL